MITIEPNQNINFKAKLGSKLTKNIQKEFENNPNRMAQFNRLFHNTFDHRLDTNLVIDIDKQNNWILSHSGFPNTKFCKKTYNTLTLGSFAKSLITECPKVLANGELQLFRVVIAKAVKKGESFDKLRELSTLFLKEKSKQTFLEQLSIAERIKTEKPDSKLSSLDFDVMGMQIANEDLKNPDSDLYKLINSLSFKA